MARRRLLAAVIRRAGDPALVDLGEIPAGLLDARGLGRPGALRGTVAEALPDAGNAARLGWTHLIAPLADHLAEQLAGRGTLILSPDGPLHALPFAAFADPDGRRLVERSTLRLVQTGRDLVGPAAEAPQPEAPGGLVAIGGVRFDDWGAPGDSPAETQLASLAGPLPLVAETPAETARTLSTPLSFLPHSLDEAKTIAEAYAKMRAGEPAPRLSTGHAASEAWLKALDRPPRVLHLATHGFYLPSGSQPERPLLQSGVMLAGADRGLAGEHGPDGEDGILHAAEVQALNLRGTELVVLSACDTGQGAPDYGEGLEGLPRAFRVAGAENVLVALWPVNDRKARDFMQRFYATWLAQPTSDPATALEATQRAALADPDPDINDPAFWAPFALFKG